MKAIESTTLGPAQNQRLVAQSDRTDLRLSTIAMSVLISATTTLNSSAIAARQMIRKERCETGSFTGCAYVSSPAAEGDSTDRSLLPVAFTHRIEEVMQLGHGIFFEDGVETLFSEKLVETMKKWGVPAVECLHNYVMSGRAEEEVAAEALRWVGGLRDVKTHEARWRFLIAALYFPSLALRDGALMGLAAMGEPRSLPFLERAQLLPANRPLRTDYEELIRQIQQVG